MTLSTKLDHDLVLWIGLLNHFMITFGKQAGKELYLGQTQDQVGLSAKARLN
jgi:hypothetical protein